MNEVDFPKYTQIKLLNGVAKFYKYQKPRYYPGVLEEFLEMEVEQAFYFKKTNPGYSDLYTTLRAVKTKCGHHLALVMESFDYFSHNTFYGKFISKEEYDLLPFERMGEYEIPESEFTTEGGYFFEPDLDLARIFTPGITRRHLTTRDGHILYRLK